MLSSSYTHSNSHPVAANSSNTANNLDDSSYLLAQTIAQAADDRKGGDIVLLKVSDVSYLADYFVVVTGFSNVQVRAIANSIEDRVEEEWQRRPLRTEGQMEGSWVLMDYGDVIVHIFLPKEREFYSLESFWGHAEQVAFSLSTSP
jgi:ribosome-associated protein